MRKGSKASPETIEKLRISHLGHKHTAETKEKIRITSTGRLHTQEAKDKISKARIGNVVISEKQRQILREYRLANPYPKEYYERLSVLFKGRPSPMKGRKHSATAKQKIKQWGVDHKDEISGANATNWRGGVSSLPYCPKFNRSFKARVRLFFNNTCMLCGEIGAKDVHHIHHNKEMCCDKSPRDVVLLCRSCHGFVNNKRKDYEQYFTNLIYTYFGGKCFLTQDEYLQLTTGE